MSLIGLMLMRIDKRAAQKGTWRIPERTLILFAAAGGAIGSYLGMHLFHHKTRHAIFRFGFPFLALLWAIIAGILGVRVWLG